MTVLSYLLREKHATGRSPEMKRFLKGHIPSIGSRWTVDSKALVPYASDFPYSDRNA